MLRDLDESDLGRTVKRGIESWVREGVKAVLEEVLEEEMSEHLEAAYRELTPARRGERNGTTPATWLRPRLAPYREHAELR